MSTNRIYFIDAVRAFAILMMLQGHFIDTLLDESFRDPNIMFYNIWDYFRGITAPTFFTISGLIFSYLLLKAKQNNKESKRIRKGLLRGLMLLGIGYSLRIPFFDWFCGKVSGNFLAVDVLQCIGLSLIIVILIYIITLKKTLAFSITMFIIGFAIFITEPLYRFLELPQIPLALSNYFSKANGSVFNIIPWFGYIAFGAFISTLFYKYLNRPKFKTTVLWSFFSIGVFLIALSSPLFIKLSEIFNIELLNEVAVYNYLFIRLGNVLIIFGLFYAAERHIKKPVILKIGQKTLSIYVIHFVIIYGSYTGIGLKHIIGRNLTPWQAIFGALLFLSSVSIIALYYTKTNKFVYSCTRKLIDKIKKN